MNIQQFQYVLAVVDSKNFEDAAERCFVTQSTLSTMIGRFENEIGMKVFNRKTKPVSVTKEGKEIIDRLRIVINEIEGLDNVIQELKGEMVGELKLGVIPTVAPYLLPLFLPKFAEKFPNLHIIIKEIPTAEIQESLKKRTIDAGLLALPLLDNDLEERELYTEPFLVYDCSGTKKEKKISVDNLDYSKLWLLNEGHCLRTQAHQICERSSLNPKRGVNFEFESGSIGSLLNFTKSSKGITIIPYLTSLDLKTDNAVNLVQFNPPTPVRSIGLITHKYFAKKQLGNELQEIIKESVKGLIPETKNPEVIKPV